MDIRSVSQEEKDKFIQKVLEIFSQIRAVLTTLEADIKAEDLMIQASAVWISGQMANWFYDFMEQIKNIENKKNEIQQEIMDASNNDEPLKD